MPNTRQKIIYSTALASFFINRNLFTGNFNFFRSAYSKQATYYLSSKKMRFSGINDLKNQRMLQVIIQHE